jgi:hypothetical protein
MTVTEIIKEWLSANGYDGLCNDDCGCLTDDLNPCCEYTGNCEAAYDHGAINGCDNWMSTAKPEEVEGCTGVDNKVPCGCPHCTAKREAARAELDAGRPDREE